jgi:tripartite ATP-independent transporter DctM subunit
VIAPIIPPGIGLILYGFLADQSVGRLFIAGIVPGVMMCFALMFVVNKISVKRNYVSARNRKATKEELWLAFKDSLWAMVIPVGIIGGIRFGVFTPTEAGAMTVMYALIVGFFAYKDLKLEHIPMVLLESILSTSVVMLIICAAGAFSFYMAWERIPMQVAASIMSITQTPWVLLLMINLLLIIVGMFVEGSAALILLTPLLAPIVEKAGVDLIHFGMVIVLNLTIAGVTPPLGTLMYATCSIIGVPVHKFSKEVIPFLLALFLVLFLITYFPGLVLFLPNLIMGK